MHFQMAPEDTSAYSTYRFAKLKHNYQEHPLFQVPELAQLARELMPLRLCRFAPPRMTQSSVFNLAAETEDGRTIDQVFEDITKPGSWIALYDVEAIPRYRELLAEMIQSVRELVAREQGAIVLVTGFIFISAPPSFTPFHIDRENNFWLQLRGRKKITVWSNTDRIVVPATAVENFIVNRSLAGVRLKDEFHSRGQLFDCGAGDGVYFPSTSPHMTESTTDWVKSDDGLAISIGVNFYTDATRRHARVYQLNHFARRLGFSPSAPGAMPFGDTVKAGLGRALVEVKRRLRGRYVPPPGTL